MPKGVFRIIPIVSTEDDHVVLSGVDFTIVSGQVAKLLRNSEFAALFMVTLGIDMDREIESLMASGELTEGFVLDAVASETADAAAHRLHRDVLAGLAEERGFRVTPRFSPGYGDLPVTAQSKILKICEGERIDIRVTESSLMIPRKSVSAVLGLEKKKA